MATETTAEKMLREARERQTANAAQDAANNAVKKADDTAAVDPKVAASKEQQDREEAAADLLARQEAARDLASKNATTNIPGVPSFAAVTPNAAGAPIPLGATIARTDEIPLKNVETVLVEDRAVGQIERPWRTFQHLYANANTIMPNGKKLIFGGQNGHLGQYSTNIPDQIKHLAELANTPGSMVTEVRQDAEGRFIVVTDAILDAEKQAALIDSRTNTARQQDPGVAQAISNLGRTIAQNS